MKRFLALILALVLTMCLFACGDSGNADMEIVRADTDENVNNEPEKTDGTEADDAEVQVDEGVYSYTAEGVELIPGEAFDASRLPEPQSTFTVPSCALEGTDNVYNYGTYEVTAYNEGNGEFIYSVYIFDANIATNEGLSVGDNKDKVIEIYGDGYTDNNGEFTYKKGDTLLVIVFQNDMVLSIDFRLDV